MNSAELNLKGDKPWQIKDESAVLLTLTIVI